MQIVGELSILNPTVPPFKRVCYVCRLANVTVVSVGEYFCKSCQRNQTTEQQPFLRGKISTETDAGETEVSIEGPWLSAIVHMSGVEFLSETRKVQIRILSKIRIVGKFQLTPTSQLVGFEEHRADEPSCSELVLANSSLDFVSPQCTPLSSVPASLEDVIPTSVDITDAGASPSHFRHGVKRKLSDVVDKKNKK